MAVTATKAVWERSRSTRSTRLVLLALADHVNEQRIQAGYPWEAWPSQRTLARLCNCSRSAVQEAIERLHELGEIADTGERRHRGTIVWEVLPDLDWTADRSSDPDDDWTGERSRETGETTTGPESGHVTGRFSETTGPGSPTTGPLPGHKPVVEPEEQKNQKIEKGRSPSAPDLLPTDSQITDTATATEPEPAALPAAQATRKEQLHQQVEREAQARELADLKAQLPKAKKGSLRDQTERCIATLEAELTADDLSDLSDPDPAELERQRLQHLEGAAPSAVTCTCGGPYDDEGDRLCVMCGKPQPEAVAA
jgi:hypothetical protein